MLSLALVNNGEPVIGYGYPGWGSVNAVDRISVLDHLST